jgi:tetratricopeptide (TPR) repeat protein
MPAEMRKHHQTHGVSRAGLASALIAIGKTREAEAELQHAITLFEELATDSPSVPVYRRSLASWRTQLGQMRWHQRRLAEAESDYRIGIDMYRKLAAEFPTEQHYLRQLPASYISLGTLLLHAGKPKEAAEAYLGASRVAYLPHDNPTQINHRHLMAIAQIQLGKMLMTDSRGDDAEKAFREAVDTYKQLHTDYGDRPESRRELAGVMAVGAQQMINSRRLADAEMLCRWALGHFVQLSAEAPESVENIDFVASEHVRLAGILAQQRRADDAAAQYRCAIERYASIAGPGLRQHDFQFAQASTHNNLGMQLSALGRVAEAAAEIQSSIELYGRLPAEYRERPGSQINLATTHGNLGMQLSSLGQYQQAASAFRNALQIYLRLPPTLLERKGLRLRLASAKNNLAWLLAACPDASLRNASEALELAKSAVELAPEVGEMWNTLGVAHYRDASWQPAIDALEKSVALRKGGDVFDWLFLAMSFHQLGQLDKAERAYEQATAWLQSHPGLPKHELDALAVLKAEADQLLDKER